MNRTSKLAAGALRNPWFLIGVVLPFLLSSIYFFGVASDQYVSESRFAIKAPNQRGGQVSSFANLFQSTGLSGGQEQSNQVLDFIRSRSALAVLVKEVDFKASYTDDKIDRLSRFPLPWQQDAFEDLYSYYQGKVEINRDPETGLVVLRSIAFDPQEAALVNEKLLQQSEKLVNELNENARSKAIAEAERLVAEAEQRVATARAAMAQYRNQTKLVDPLTEATGVVEIANRLISQRAMLEAELNTLQSVTPDHPSIPATKQQIASLTREINRQTARLAGGPNTISSKLPSYDSLLQDQELAAELLVLAQTTLEQARADALKQQFYLERVVDPNVPDLPEYPKALKIVLTITAAALTLYFIIWMFVVGILEHAPEE